MNTQHETILQEANRLIFGDREKTYGDPGKNLKRIAELWETYLQAHTRNAISHAVQLLFSRQLTNDELRSLTNEVNLALSYKDVCHMMQLLKWARDENFEKRDNVVDDVGYGALVDRVRSTPYQHSFSVSDPVTVNAPAVAGLKTKGQLRKTRKG